MAIRSSFFNSVGRDRVYEASNFASYFASFIGNGVFPNPSTNLQVIANGNMSVAVKAGKGWINGYYLINDGDFILQHAVSDDVLNRIDRVVMALNLSTRDITISIKKGTPSTNPIAPALIRDGTIHELALANVYVNRSIVQITQANIVDTRMDTSVCGIVSGTVSQVDTTTLYNQYQDDFMQWSEQQRIEFQEFLDSIEEALDGNIAANLQNQINNKADIDSPTLTGSPKTTNPNLDDNSTRIASTSYVRSSFNQYFFTRPASSNASNIWVRLGQVSTSNTGASKLSVIIDGLGSNNGNQYDTVLLNASYKTSFSFKVQTLSVNTSAASLRARYGYVVNSANSQIEIWLMLPTYANRADFLRLGNIGATFDFSTTATTEPAGIVYITTSEIASVGTVQTYVGNRSALLTNEKSNTVGAINELFTSVGNAKNGIAAAITSKGVTASGDDTFAQLINKIGNIQTGAQYASGNFYSTDQPLDFYSPSPSAGTFASAYLRVSGLPFIPKRIIIESRAHGFITDFKSSRTAGLEIVENLSNYPTTIYSLSGNAYVDASGFVLPIPNGIPSTTLISWSAYAE